VLLKVTTPKKYAFYNLNSNVYLITRVGGMHFTVMLIAMSIKRKSRKEIEENPHLITEHPGS